MSKHLDQYLALFGLKPGATLQQASSRYFHYLKQFPENLTAEQDEAKRRLQHAYEVLKRAYRSGGSGTVTKRKKRRKRRPGGMSPAARSVPLGLGVALLIAVGVFMYLNRANIKVHMQSHEVGDMVRWHDSPKTYGKVMRFDPDHSFGSGIPGPAYEIQLEGTTDTVWVGERIAETRMARVGQ